MASTITLNYGAGSAMTVTAHPTATPGLVVHDYGLFGDEWRLTHVQSRLALGEFDEYDDAQNAALALFRLTDWTAGRFLYRKGGLGERVAAKRAEALAAKGGAA